ncbi:MAG: hypothetical protein ACOYBW_05515 [Fluviibacter phosphoraccumulans]
MSTFTMILVVGVFPLIAFVVTWKIYNFFLSLNDAVHLSYFQYFVKRLIASIIVAVIAIIIGVVIFEDHPKSSNSHSVKTSNAENNSTPISGATNSEPVTESKSPASFDLRDPAYKPKPVQTSEPPTPASCPSGIPTFVCKNPDLMSVRSNANAALMRANGRNQSDTAWIKNALIERLNACGDDTSCIKSAYQRSIDEFNAVQTESR